MYNMLFIDYWSLFINLQLYIAFRFNSLLNLNYQNYK